MPRWRTRGNALVALGVGLGVAVALVRRRHSGWAGRVVLITGASSGLGFLLAKQLAMEGSRLVLCSQDAGALGRARTDLERYGAAVMVVPCDVSDRVQVECMMEEVLVRFGAIDVVINTAGTIQPDPAASITVAEFERAMAANFWGLVHTTFAALPSMLSRRHGQIVNITTSAAEVGGSDQMLPFRCAVRAAAGFSDGLRMEMRGKGVRITTIFPEVTDAAPERAARQILQAARRGQAECVVPVPARLLADSIDVFLRIAPPLSAYQADGHR